jgi:hypothetical protein
MLEQQLADLKKMLELQTSLAAMARSNTVTMMEETPVENISSSTSTNSFISETSALENKFPTSTNTMNVAATPARPRMGDILANASQLQLRKVGDPLATKTTGVRRNVPASTGADGGGLGNMLRSAIQKRFQTLHTSRPGTTQMTASSPAASSPGGDSIASSGFPSPNGSNASPARAMNRRTSNSAMLVAAAAYRRASISTASSTTVAPPRSSMGVASAASMPPRNPMSGDLLNAIKGFKTDALKSISAPVETAVSQNTAINSNTVTTVSSTTTEPSSISNLPKKSFLADISSFDRKNMKSVSKSNSSASPKPSVLRPKSINDASILSPAGRKMVLPNASASSSGMRAFNPADISRVTLRKTGVQRTNE